MSGFPGFRDGRGRGSQMATVKAGVVTGIEVQSMNPTVSVDYTDQNAPSFWAVVWFLTAVFILFVVL